MKKTNLLFMFLSLGIYSVFGQSSQINLGAATTLKLAVFAMGNGLSGHLSGDMTGAGPNTRWGVLSSVSFGDPASIVAEIGTGCNIAAGPGVDIDVSDGTIWQSAIFYGDSSAPACTISKNGFTRFNGTSIISGSSVAVIPYNLSQARLDVINAANTISNLPADTTVSSISDGNSFNIKNGKNQVYIIRVTNGCSFGSSGITLTGDPGDKFIFDILNSSNGKGISITNGEIVVHGIDAIDIIWNVHGDGGGNPVVYNETGSSTAFRGTIIADSGTAHIAGGGFSGAIYAVSIEMKSGGLFIGKPIPEGVFPVELSSFASNVNGRNVQLNWETKTEKNSDKFVIERKTIDATWEAMGSVKASVLSNSPKQYSFVDNNLQSGKYQYRLKMVDNDGSYSYSSVEAAEVAVPKDFALSQNYPNPFNPSTKIDYQLPVDAKVILEVYNIAGQKVSELVNQEQSAGYYTVDFGASKLSSGVYIYRIVASDKATGNNFSLIKKMMLLK
jgi:hypothetical protein